MPQITPLTDEERARVRGALPRYELRLVPADEGGFWVEFPEWKGCHRGGETAEQAIANAYEALELHAEMLLSQRRREDPDATVADILPVPQATAVG